MQTNFTPQTILRGIRNHNIKSLIGFACCFLLGLVFAIGGIWLARDGSYLYGLFAFLLAAGIDLYAISMFCKRFYTLTHLEQCRLLRKYGPIEHIADQITEEYDSPRIENKQVLVAEHFIMKRKDFESFVPYEHILLLYKKEHRTNGVLDGVFLVVIDEYGDTFEYPFKLGKKHVGDVAFVANEIVKLAPRCRVGYVAENLQYAKDNKKPLAVGGEDSWQR